MKKILALVLAFAMMFSTITVAFAEGEVSAEAKALAAIGMLEGDGSGVTVEYTAKELNKLTAAIMILKLKGLYADAVKYEGTNNFVDVEKVAWAEGKNILAYVKDNPVGFGGNEKGEFGPYDTLSEQMYYKVLLENLGYKQTTPDVAGDFAWDEVLTFAESLGFKPAKAEKFTVDGLAKATVEALKAKTKDGKVWINVLVEAGKINKDAAIAAGLYEEAKTIEVAVDEVKAIGNSVVQVVFEDDVDAAAAGNLENYAIDGLEVREVIVTGSDTVRVYTAAMTAGKLYTMTVGGEKVKFAGIGKVSGAPSLKAVESTDIEEVVLTFDKNLDFESATNTANYTIAGVEVVEAEVDGKEVTLTTNGLVARKQYTVKVANVESIDGGLLKSTSKSFYTRPDTTAPKVEDVYAETNQRVVVLFSEKVTKDSAENLENYTIMQGNTELNILEAKLITSGSNKNKKVELTTEAQTVNKKHELTISNIVDTTKAANAMPKAVKKTFYGKREDTAAPTVDTKVEVISRNLLKVTFKDASKLDEASVLDANNYALTKSNDDFVVEKVEKVSSENGKFVALLTVEDLNVGTYTLTIDDVADEFGNAIDKEVRRTVNVTRDSLASSTIKNVTIDGKNKITITFTKPLNEESAEDIANYSINKDINTPLSATYKDNNDIYKVELETIDLTVGVKYDVTVKGVEDLAGNVLDLKMKGVLASGDWKEDAPELDDVYVVNKYVLALAFDKKVSFAEGTKLVLKGVDEDGKAVAPVTLFAKALAENDTVVEFSNYPSVKLDENILYTIDSITGTIKNVSGVAYAADDNFDDYKVYGTDEEPAYAEVLNVAQINGRQFEVTMSKNVVAVVSSVSGLAVEVDDDVVTLTKSSNIKDTDEYKIDFAKVLKDEHGIPAINMDDDDYTVVYGEYEDDENPYIVNVTAVDRFTVEVEYNEAVKGAKNSTYSVKNSDSEISKTELVEKVEVDDEIVTITLKQPLEGRYDYTLTIKSEDVTDLAGNKAEEKKDDEFYFNGTDLAPIVKEGSSDPGEEPGEEPEEYLANVTAKGNVATNVSGSYDSAVTKVEVEYKGLTKTAKMTSGTFSWNIFPGLASGQTVVVKAYVGTEVVQTLEVVVK